MKYVSLGLEEVSEVVVCVGQFLRSRQDLVRSGKVEQRDVEGGMDERRMRNDATRMRR
jgi:hypothetical protein